MSESERIEPKHYATMKRYLKGAMEHMLAAGRSVGEFSEFTLEKFGDNARPYLREFMSEVRDGRVKVEGLTKSALTALRGQRVSPQQREAMIRDAAYFRAQQRGFTGGSPDDDWRAAEQEVDAQLAEMEGGVINKGRKLLGNAAIAAEAEIGNIRQAVTSWIEARRSGAAHEAATVTAPAAPPAKTVDKTAKPTKPKAAPKKSAVAKKTKQASTASAKGTAKKSGTKGSAKA